MFIIVVLPEPDGPTIATNSPGLDVEADVGQGRHLDVAHVVDPADADRGAMIGVGHRQFPSVPTARRRRRTAATGDAAEAAAAEAAGRGRVPVCGRC